ncbi:MAG: hypothetical protein JRN52_04940 [Nitrososphaerota archaeon]|nr:hypothetical protein [Nitrososphaerota archaeon]
MTDPLTAKELVQKSYEYIDKLTKECAKVLLDEYNKTHRKFEPSKIHDELAADILKWFERRDRNVRLSFNGSSVTKSSPTQSHMNFRGSTKDADFALGCSLSVFVPPGSEANPNPVCFVKTITITADKASFSKRK